MIINSQDSLNSSIIFYHNEVKEILVKLEFDLYYLHGVTNRHLVLIEIFLMLIYTTFDTF